jgi:methionine aminopeptidase
MVNINYKLKQDGLIPILYSDIAEKNGYSVSDELSGHGIGKEFHCLPLVYHHRNQEEGIMTVGSTFTIVSFYHFTKRLGSNFCDLGTHFMSGISNRYHVA